MMRQMDPWECQAMWNTYIKTGMYSLIVCWPLIYVVEGKRGALLSQPISWLSCSCWGCSGQVGFSVNPREWHFMVGQFEYLEQPHDVRKENSKMLNLIIRMGKIYIRMYIHKKKKMSVNHWVSQSLNLPRCSLLPLLHATLPGSSMFCIPAETIIIKVYSCIEMHFFTLKKWSGEMVERSICKYMSISILSRQCTPILTGHHMILIYSSIVSSLPLSDYKCEDSVSLSGPEGTE